MAKRCASSRTRCRRYSASLDRGRTTGSSSARAEDLLQALGQRRELEAIAHAPRRGRVDGGVELAETPVDDEEVGVRTEAVAAGLVAPVGEPSVEHLAHRADVVVAPHRLHGEVPVRPLHREGVFEHHHRAHVARALEVAHVEALDPVRGAREPERALELEEGLGPRVVVRRAAQAVRRQVLGRVARVASSTTLRRRPRSGATTRTGPSRTVESHAPRRSRSAPTWSTTTSRGGGRSASYRSPRNALEQLGVAEVVHEVGPERLHGRPRGPGAPRAHDVGLQLVARRPRSRRGRRGPTRSDLLGVRRALDVAERVAQPRRRLVVLRLGGGLHPSSRSGVSDAASPAKKRRMPWTYSS